MQIQASKQHLTQLPFIDVCMLHGNVKTHMCKIDILTCIIRCIKWVTHAVNEMCAAEKLFSLYCKKLKESFIVNNPGCVRFIHDYNLKYFNEHVLNGGLWIQIQLSEKSQYGSSFQKNDNQDPAPIDFKIRVRI